MVEPSEKNESLESSSEVALENVHLEPWEAVGFFGFLGDLS